MIRILLSCAVIICLVSKMEAATVSDTKNLLSDITNGYNKEVRPVNDQTEHLDVAVDMHLLSIKDFDEVSGTLNVLAAFKIDWKDISIGWDPTLYGNLTSIKMGQDNIWLPKLYNIKASDKFKAISNSDLQVEIDYHGAITWSPGSFLDIKCSPDVSYFPFDIQTCAIQLAAWGYTYQEVTLKSNNPAVNLDFYETNGEWSLDKSSTDVQTPGPYSFVFFNLTISRLPAFHIVNTMIPIYLLLMMNPLVFVLPCDSGERVGFSLTVFLTFTVFITIINSVLPANSDNMSRLSYYIIAVFVTSGIIASINIFQLRMYHKDEHLPVPRWVVRMMRILNCQLSPKRRIIEVCPENTDSKSSNKKEQREAQMEEAAKVAVMDTMTWKEVVHILDTFCIWFFYVILSVFIIFSIVTLYWGNR
ncbi:acetylcholine receptor subunit alpha-1-B-like [Ylistrum balloti]|uniref:acetylcholine receptor subunit alpha-1-B-like n=1 Tax=Ylistrum balloti TaxID=509963 RepID=UPI002905F4C7|nr:acetylcholine receptor subunit alpha-1-B-like [Ylistrum balloti]